MSVNFISITAGPITATGQAGAAEDTQQVQMGLDLFIHITPAIAQQWIDTLTTITAEENNA